MDGDVAYAGHGQVEGMTNVYPAPMEVDGDEDEDPSSSAPRA